MNVFVLDEDMQKSAEYTCDKHVVRMITEHVELLCSAYFFTDQADISPYYLCNANHPIAKWVRASLSNWLWLRDYTLVLYGEYKYRYFNRVHKAGEVCKKLITPALKDNGPTKMPCAMPDIYKTDSVVQSYRNYYIGAKQHIIRYTKRDVPEWYVFR